MSDWRATHLSGRYAKTACNTDYHGNIDVTDEVGQVSCARCKRTRRYKDAIESEREGQDGRR